MSETWIKLDELKEPGARRIVEALCRIREERDDEFPTAPAELAAAQSVSTEHQGALA